MSASGTNFDHGLLFLSYRRDDVPDAVDRIADRFRECFGKLTVFVDIVSIAAGEKWREVLAEALGSCVAILIVIGPNWLRKANDGQSLALDDPDDPVRNEISTALRREISVIPILWGDARVPPSQVLPLEVRGITEYQASSIRREHFESDVRILLERVEAQVQLFATLGRRLGAFFIDTLPALAINTAIGGAFWVFWLLLVVYHWVLIGATGQTLGKFLMGTRVALPEPTGMRWVLALARPLLGYPVVLFSGIGAIQLVLHPQHLALHDRLFRSFVVQLRRRPPVWSLRRIDWVSYLFDGWLLRFLAGVGLWSLVTRVKNFFEVDRLVERVGGWLKQAEGAVLKSRSAKRTPAAADPVPPDSPTISSDSIVSPPASIVVPSDLPAVPSDSPAAASDSAAVLSGSPAGLAIPAQVAVSRVSPVMQAGAQAMGTATSWVAPLIVGFGMAAASIAIYEVIVPASLSVLPGNRAPSAKAEPRQKLPSDARVPVMGCRAFFSGLLISDVFEDGWTSVAFVRDEFSEYVGSGSYHDNGEAFPKSIRSTFDGIAVDNGSRVEIFSKKNFGGVKVLDIEGPAIINNRTYAQNRPDLATKQFKGDLQALFPQRVRQWSTTDMDAWKTGSMRITCGKWW